MTEIPIPSAWDIVSCQIGGETVPAANDKGFVALRDGQIGGHTGCNSFGGDWTGKPSTMDIPGVMSTKMFCAESADQERLLLDLLNGTVTAEADGKQLTLSGTAGKIKLVRNDARLK